MRARMEHHADKGVYPPIQVHVTLGKEDLTVKMSDWGGGVPLRTTDQLFNYTYTAAPRPHVEMSRAVPLTGFGYGSPISRLYVQYFQGELKLSSLEGHGTDTVIYIKALSTESIQKDSQCIAKLLEALQHQPWGGRLVCPQQRTKRHDDIPQCLDTFGAPGKSRCGFLLNLEGMVFRKKKLKEYRLLEQNNLS